jgi:2-polyprenyl-3-methyl-5-hydroxy-6-metoxy-1,4-benzoquinol methylase
MTAYIEGQVGGNHYNKYQARNPIARKLMNGFLTAFDDLVARSGCRSFYEIGCGEGELSFRIANQGFHVSGSDISSDCVKKTEEKFRNTPHHNKFNTKNIFDLHHSDTIGAEAIIICEVFEHLNDPHTALEKISSLEVPGLIASVPREPIWCSLNMARGKYLSRWGNTPGHVQHWTKSGFLQFISQKYYIEAIRTPLPWTMVLGKRK